MISLGRRHPSLPVSDAIKGVGIAAKLGFSLGGEATGLGSSALHRCERRLG